MQNRRPKNSNKKNHFSHKGKVSKSNNPREKKPSEKQQGNFAKKSLGQNFLRSPNIRHQIIQAAELNPGGNVLEIGPGLGFLTTGLLDEKVNLKAVDLDDRVIPILEKEFGHKENFNLIHGDILVQDITELFGGEPYKVVANIPYNITGPILRKFLDKETVKPSRLILMVQKEVAHKICDPTSDDTPQKKEKPAEQQKSEAPTIGLAAQNALRGLAVSGKSIKHKRSILSLSVEIFATSRIVCDVPRNLFNPVPKVDSAVIELNIRPEPLISPELQRDFFTIINAGFSQRRKKIGNYFGKFFGLSSKDLLGDIDPQRRSETFSVEEWVAITKRFQELNH